MKIKRYHQNNNIALFLMLLPGIVVLIVNNYLPMFGTIMAFENYNPVDGLLGSPWVGLNNFKFLFKTQSAWVITRNVILYNLTFIFIAATIAVFLAIMLNEIRSRKLSKFFQSVYFLPYFLSWVVIGYLVYALLNSRFGLMNNMLELFGGKPIQWYLEPKYWPMILVLVNTWKWTGYDSVIYLAAIVGFSKTYYEAAAVDGATWSQQIKCITLPLLKPIVVILTLLKIGRIFYTDFGLFYVVPKNSGILFNTVGVIDTYVYNALMVQSNVGMAAAAGLYQALVGLIIMLIFNGIVRKVSPENALF